MENEISDQPAQEELQARLLYAMLGPAARMAANFATPVKELSNLTAIGYYREARRRRMKMREIQELMDVSMSKAAALSKKLKGHFALIGSDHGVDRRVMSLLWAEPLTLGRIVSAIDDVEPEEVEETVNQLVESKRLREVPGRTMRYELSSPQYRLVEDRWVTRFEALNSFMTAVGQAVESRFLTGDERAFVRTLRFRANPEDLGQLHEAYEELFRVINELDAAASDNPVAMRLSLLWAPDPDAKEDERRGGK